MENYSGSVIITQEKSVLQKTAHSHIQKEETQKLIRRKLAVGWKLKVTRDSQVTNYSLFGMTSFLAMMPAFLYYRTFM